MEVKSPTNLLAIPLLLFVDHVTETPDLAEPHLAEVTHRIVTPTDLVFLALRMRIAETPMEVNSQDNLSVILKLTFV